MNHYINTDDLSQNPNLAGTSYASTNPGGQRVLLNLQQAIVHALENQENSGGFDGRTDTKFIADTWERPEGGGGRSCVLSGGQVIEKSRRHV